MYLADWKENLPDGKVHASTVRRTSPAGRKPFQPAIGFGYPLRYPDIRQVWGGKRPSKSAPPGRYPLVPADNGYPQPALGFNLGFYLTSVKIKHNCENKDMGFVKSKSNQNWYKLFGKHNGGLPVKSGTLTEVDLDPKTLDSCREI
jgi:hypothetical protein